MRRIVIAAIAGLLVAGQGLVAGPALALEAEELREKLLESFAFYEAAAGAEALDPFRYGDVRVEPQGEAFRVTVEALSVLTDSERMHRLDVGTVGFTMTSAGDLAGDALFRVSDLALPTIMRVTDAKGVPGTEFRFASVRLDSLWSFAYQSNLNLDALIEGIDVVATGGVSVLKASELAVELRSVEKDESVYDMTLDTRLKAVFAQGPAGRVNIKELDALVEFADYKLAAQVATYRKLAELGHATDDQDRFYLSALGLLLTPETWGGENALQLTARGLRLAGAPETGALVIDLLELNANVTDFDKPLSRIGLSLNQQGMSHFKLSKAEEAVEDWLLPQESKLTVSFANLPLGQIIQDVSTTMGDPEAAETLLGESADPAVSERVDALMDGLEQRLGDAVTRAGTTIELSDTRVVTRETELQAEGSFVIDAKAVFGMSGGLLAELFGLENLMALAQAGLADPEAETRDEAMGMLGVLGVLQGYAARGADGEGRPVDRYELVVLPTGEVTVNGKPVLPAMPVE